MTPSWCHFNFQEALCFAVSLVPWAVTTAGSARPIVTTASSSGAAGTGSDVACTHPLPAWRTPSGGVVLREPHPRPDGTVRLHVPCGRCVGCRFAQARSWAVRCQLELSRHRSACWVTLTYDEDHVPHTLHLRDFQNWLKRLRKFFAGRAQGRRRVRYFGCGEYGEKGGRPHYHCILFGVSQAEAWAVAETWRRGNVRVDPLSPAAIAYVCGYALKKAGPERRKLRLGHRRSFFYAGPSTAPLLDRKTGEMYRLRIDYQPEFVVMSRRPGIGGHAREFAKSWRSSAIWHGKEVPVPRYLHQAWKDQASPSDLLSLEEEKQARAPQNLEQLQERLRHLGQQALINRAKLSALTSKRKL